MDIEVISRETVKPSSPTLPHLRIYPLSFLDHVIFSHYIPVVYLYEPTITIENREEKSDEVVKKSLYQVLAMYYPLPGRIRDRASIDCNDEGATLLVNHIKYDLSGLWPMGIRSSTLSKTGPPLPENLNLLEKRKKEKKDLPNYPEIAFARDNTLRCKRFILDASKIQSLKAMISQQVKNPTRVQVASAFLYKSAVSALSSSFKSSNQPTWLCSWANLRTRMLPPVPEKTIGNMIWYYIVSATMEEGLNEVVYKLKHSLTEFCDTHVEQFGRKDKSFISEILQQATSWDPDNTDMVGVDITSWCRFPLYEADFGWGKPIWVTTTCCPHRNCMFLKDTRDGDGIEVLVNMEENEMALFERDVLQYASVSPGI
ncbi:(13S,14R)-1,13-dihydroxy-N-methylcanadine 13-O-acetyltransferase AT1-like [Prosopis cineraria]|uniref:(13S,14R)-1,13-dihydroxy-N-methylcanadine 13-O-acetyltransferase AT1-like n=1 Tax=Prosopis cineraria TaxID=364024 RepID=UPI00241048D7|nr:(13S,14R)-1,13-dihydroxy-N-methylcanadine 13-O-acetyltransferase AT1-like [Prosopis cineraria]